MTISQIWYMRPEYFRNGIMGYDFCNEQNCLPDPKNLDKTHVFLTYVVANDLEAIFTAMQGEIWSPNGEARPLIEQKGLIHTSMSVGDVVISNGKTYITDCSGFKQLED